MIIIYYDSKNSWLFAISGYSLATPDYNQLQLYIIQGQLDSSTFCVSRGGLKTNKQSLSYFTNYYVR